jgi:hypothetical protein
MHCRLGIGFFLASFTLAVVGSLGPDAWLYMCLGRVRPAMFRASRLNFARPIA